MGPILSEFNFVQFSQSIYFRSILTLSSYIPPSIPGGLLPYHFSTKVLHDLLVFPCVQQLVLPSDTWQREKDLKVNVTFCVMNRVFCV
jgi:hypothetical protein